VRKPPTIYLALGLHAANVLANMKQKQCTKVVCWKLLWKTVVKVKCYKRSSALRSRTIIVLSLHPLRCRDVTCSRIRRTHQVSRPPRKRLLLPVGETGPPFNSTWFLRLTRPTIPNGISIASAVFARLTVVTNRPTDRPIHGDLATLYQ